MNITIIGDGNLNYPQVQANFSNENSNEILFIGKSCNFGSQSLCGNSKIENLQQTIHYKQIQEMYKRSSISPEIPAQIPFKLVFNFTSDFSEQKVGWRIDNVKISPKIVDPNQTSPLINVNPIDRQLIFDPSTSEFNVVELGYVDDKNLETVKVQGVKVISGNIEAGIAQSNPQIVTAKGKEVLKSPDPEYFEIEYTLINKNNQTSTGTISGLRIGGAG
jgi:hypothetical protein